MARRFISTEYNSRTLGISLADRQAAGRWSLNNGAECYAVGVGTGIAGFRAKLGLIDDPIEAADQDAGDDDVDQKIE
jgi:hypothetical protein